MTDEATAAMMSRRSGLTVTALRFPFLAMPDDRLPEHADELAAHPENGIGDLWSYLDTRDAARAVLLALRRTGGDSLVVGRRCARDAGAVPDRAADRALPAGSAAPQGVLGA